MENPSQSKTTCRDGGPREVDLEPRFECPICLQCLKDPVLTSCGHRFCDPCIRPWFSKQEKCLCPVDNTPLSASDLFPDHFTRREILGLIHSCPECSKEVRLSDYDAHLAEHNLVCPYRDVGCTETLKKPLYVHLNEQVAHHLMLVSKKLKDNEKAQEALLWDPKKHTEKEDNNLIRNLYERIVVAEQRILELQSQVQVVRQTSASAISRLENSSGEFVWRVHNIRELIAPIKPPIEGESAGRAVRFSPAFATSPLGYRMCARINLSPNFDQLSFVLHLLQSEHDDTLDWPLIARIKMMLIHPLYPERTISETVMSQPRLNAFHRPLMDMNPKAFGFPEFISVEEILGLGFVKDNMITFRIAITCV